MERISIRSTSRIIAKACSAFHRAFAMTLSLDNVLNTWARERARLCRSRDVSCVRNQAHTAVYKKPDEKKCEGKNQNWMKHTKKQLLDVELFSHDHVRSCKKTYNFLYLRCCFVCCVYRMRRTKNLSIKIERKSVSEGSHTWWKHERRKNEAIEAAENEKSFNFQSIIKVVIKRNFSFFPRLFF